jgi:urease accessory protein
MDIVTEILPAGHWARGCAGDVVRLPYDDRFRRRRRYVAAGGLEFLLDLPEARLLADGDGLRLASGTVVAVEAMAESLLEVAGKSETLARLAWHLGNRHVAVEVAPDRLRLREDKVTVDLLVRLGVSFERLEAPFNPEPGVAGPGHVHGAGGGAS